MNKELFNKVESQQHFGLRKLTVGVASVLVGTTFMIYSGRAVQADTNDNSDNNSAQEKAVEVSQSSNTQGNVQKVVVTKDAGAKDNNLAANNQQNAPVVNKSKQESVSDLNAGQINIPDNLPLTDADTKAKYMAASKLNKADLSDDQLAKLGIDRDTYIKDGVKYKAVATAVVQTDNGYVNLGKVPAFHKENGELDLDYYHQIDNYINDDANFDTTADLGIIGVNYLPNYAPYLTGKTIYVNMGDALTKDDAVRALPTEYEKGYKDVAWDKQIDSQVDVNTPGTYSTAIDVTYDNQVGVSADTKVIVVDLSGKTIYGSVSDHGNGIDTDPKTVVTGYPEGSTDFTWVGEQPDINTAGSHDGIVEVTYPDGNKGRATVHYIISNPTWVTPTPTTPEGKLPDPHDVITLNPGVPTLPNDPGTKVTWTKTPDVSKPGTIDTSVTVTYPDGHTTVVPGQIIVTKTDTETKQVVRTIVDNVPGQDPIKTAQTITFTREVTTDGNGHVLKATDWKTSGTAFWNAYQAHGADGYTATPASVPAMAVNPDTASTTVEINYTKNAPVNPDTPAPQPEPSQPSEPTDDNNNNEPAPTPHAPSVPSTDNDKDIKKPASSKGNGNHDSSSVRPLATKKTGFASNSNRRALAAANRVSKRSALPQTGSKQNGFVAAIGAAIAAVGSLFGLASRRKKY